MPGGDPRPWDHNTERMGQQYANGLDVQSPGGWRAGVHGFHVIAALILSLGLLLLIYVTREGLRDLRDAQQTTTTTIAGVTKQRDAQMERWIATSHEDHLRLREQYDAVLWLLCSMNRDCKSLNIAPPRALRDLQRHPDDRR